MRLAARQFQHLLIGPPFAAPAFAAIVVGAFHTAAPWFADVSGFDWFSEGEFTHWFSPLDYGIGDER